jgi:hypothetical protein
MKRADMRVKTPSVRPYSYCDVLHGIQSLRPVRHC